MVASHSNSGGACADGACPIDYAAHDAESTGGVAPASAESYIQSTFGKFAQQHVADAERARVAKSIPDGPDSLFSAYR